MRIEKYLKVARVLKRRVVAKELAENDRLLINGRIAKAGTEVKLGDEITIIFGHRELKIRILVRQSLLHTALKTQKYSQSQAQAFQAQVAVNAF